MSRLLQHLVSERAARQPEAVAIVLQGGQIRYSELELHSNRIARWLKDMGCRRGDRVGLLTPKSIPAIAAMLGALKADCVYVPLDVASPAARLETIVRACEPRCILAAGAGAERLTGVLETIPCSPRIGWLEKTDISGFSAAPLDYANSPANAAHILFTSGSTGVPKGVVITHENVTHFVDWCVRYFDYQPGERLSGQPPLIFDLSTMDIYATLSAGATLYPVTPEMSLLPHKLAAFIRDAELTQWFSAPSLMNYMARFDVIRPNDFPALKRVIWCGEPFPTPALIHWMKMLPHVRFTNLYGPTETTIASSYYTLPSVPESETSLTPIGAPCQGENLRVLDQEFRPVAAGEIGELYIGGAGLSPGYWKDPAKTAAAFLPDPQNPGQRIYRTGDLASVDAAGLFYVHGRTDSQIKSRGYRIELGEVERAVSTVSELKECAVVAVDAGGFEGSTICCAYSVRPGASIDSREIRRRILEWTPAYMAPALWMELPALPHNQNGKIDRPALRALFSQERTEVSP